jgi:hypothetical protein
MKGVETHRPIRFRAKEAAALAAQREHPSRSTVHLKGAEMKGRSTWLIHVQTTATCIPAYFSGVSESRYLSALLEPTRRRIGKNDSG